MKAKYNKMQSVVKQRELGAYTFKKSILFIYDKKIIRKRTRLISLLRPKCVFMAG